MRCHGIVWPVMCGLPRVELTWMLHPLIASASPVFHLYSVVFSLGPLRKMATAPAPLADLAEPEPEERQERGLYDALLVAKNLAFMSCPGQCWRNHFSVCCLCVLVVSTQGCSQHSIDLVACIAGPGRISWTKEEVASGWQGLQIFLFWAWGPHRQMCLQRVHSSSI